MKLALLLPLLLLALCPSAWCAITAPSNCAVAINPAAFSTAAFGTVASQCITPASNVAGHHIWVAISYEASADVTTGCSDTAGNTYTLVQGGVVYDGIIEDLCYADNIVAASGNVVTATLSSMSGVGTKVIYAEEGAGFATSTSLDTWTITEGYGSGASKAITTASAGEYIAAFTASNSCMGGTPCSGGGSTAPGTGFTQSYPATGAVNEFFSAYQIAGSGGSYTAAPFWTYGTHYVMMMAAFRAGSGVTITLSPSSLSNGTVGTVYSQSITAAGGTIPYTYAVTSGTMIPGCTLSSGGAITGTPTTAGTYNFTVTATDSASNTGAMAYTVTISAPAASFAVTTDGVTTLWMPNAWGDGTASVTTGGLSGAITHLPNCSHQNIVAITHGMSYLMSTTGTGLVFPNLANASCNTLLTTDTPWAVPATGVRGVGTNPPIILAAVGASAAVIGFANGAHDIRVYGIEATIASGGTDVGYYYLVNTGLTGGGPSGWYAQSSFTQRITFDHDLFTGVFNQPGPCRDIGLDGLQHRMLDSILEEAKGTWTNPRDCQAMLSTTCINCKVQNTQVNGITENYMSGGLTSSSPGYMTVGMEFAGSFFTNHIQWRRFFTNTNPSVGDLRPSCVYYAPDNGYAGTVGGEYWQNNGGASTETSDYSTGPTWQCNSGGTWTSLGTVSLFTGYGNSSQIGGQNGGKKNNFEVKFGKDIHLWGSVLSNGWQYNQDELMIENGPDTVDNNSSRGTTNVTVDYNIMRDAHGCWAAGTGFSSGPLADGFTGIVNRNNVLDDCSQMIRGWSGSPAGSQGAGLFGATPNYNGYAGYNNARMTRPGGWVMTHNTNTNSFGAATGTSAYSFGSYSGVDTSTLVTPAVFGLGSQFINNVFTMMQGGIGGSCSMNPVQMVQYGGAPACNDNAIHYYVPDSDLSYNVISLDGVSFGTCCGSSSDGRYGPYYNTGSTGGPQNNYLPLSVTTVLTNAIPATWSGTNWTYGDYSVVSNATGCNPATGAGGTGTPSGNCQGAASDGSNPGADWYTVNGFTAHAVDGLLNPDLQFLVSLPAIRLSSSSEKISFQAPLASSSCSVLVAATENFGSPVGTHAYTQAGQEVSDTITGLSGHAFFFKVTCPDANNSGATNLVRGPYTFTM